jgi:hypothetical protein
MEDRMQLAQPIWADPAAHLAQTAPDAPVMYFAPTVLAATLRRFRSGFPGMVTYAVKANPLGVVLDNLLAAGIEGFDVASPAEIALVRDRSDGAALHYHNPVRSAAEIAAGVGAHVASWSVDDPAELDKLAAGQPRPTEIAVRLRLPIAGGQYNFGEKFGADPEHAAPLLSRVAAMGHRPAITFHPGTQCTSGAAWAGLYRGGGRYRADRRLAAVAPQCRGRVSRPPDRGGARSRPDLRYHRGRPRATLSGTMRRPLSANRAAPWWPRHSPWPRGSRRCARMAR